VPEDTPAALRRLADQIESASCTGIAAQWCPVHGTCKCPRNEDCLPQLDDPRCPLHGTTSSHAEAYRAVESDGT
jgi:hypothetical protein